MPEHPGIQYMQRFNRLRFLALLPVFIAAVWNTGQQYTLAMHAVEQSPVAQWRDRLALMFGFDLQSSGAINTIIAGLVFVVSTIAITLIAVGFVERMASGNGARQFDKSVLYFALIFAFLMPPSASVFHILFGATLGVFLGHTIFGGTGKSFLNPALVGIALTQVSFPAAHTGGTIWSGVNGYAGTTIFSAFETQEHGVLTWLDITWWDAFTGAIQGFLGAPSTLAAVVAAIILIYGNVISWRLIAGQVLGVIIVSGLFNLSGTGMLAMPWYGHLLLGSFAFSAVFLAADPCSAACTNAGRWVQGLMTGALIVFMRVMHPAHPDSVVAVMLLMSMLAPLIDHSVVHFNIRRRMHRHSAAQLRGSTDG